jgi:hypothetical protein
LAQTTLHNHYPYIDRRCLDHGLLEHRIETTSEVVSILIGSAARLSERANKTYINQASL